MVSFREGLKEPLHLPCGRIDEVVDKTSSIDSDEAIDDDTVSVDRNRDSSNCSLGVTIKRCLC